jgi:hypothetical protein
MYYAQVLEHGLVNLVVARRLGSTVTTNEARESLWTELFALTMGAQIRQVLKEAVFTDAQVARLEKALALRNFLAHNYFRERDTMLLSTTGRNRMLTELEDWRTELKELDTELEPITFSALARWGVTREAVEAEMQRIQKEQEDRDGNLI